MRGRNGAQGVTLGHRDSQLVSGRVINATAESFEKLTHDLHVTDVRYVREVVLTRRQEAGRHLLEHRIFRPVRSNLTFEGAGGLYNQRSHPLSIAANSK